LNVVLYVLSGTYQEARDFAIEQGIKSPRKFVYIDRYERIAGIRKKTAYIVGTAYQREDYRELLLRLKYHNFEIVNV